MKTIKEVKEAKANLEKDIAALVLKFEQENEVEVCDLGMKEYGIVGGTSLNARYLDVNVRVEL